MKLMALVLSLYSVNAFSYWKIHIQDNGREKSPLTISNFQTTGNKLVSGHQCSFSQVGNGRDSKLAVQCQRGDDILTMSYPCMGPEVNEFSFVRARTSMNFNIKCFYAY